MLTLWAHWSKTKNSSMESGRYEAKSTFNNLPTGLGHYLQRLGLWGTGPTHRAPFNPWLLDNGRGKAF